MRELAASEIEKLFRSVKRLKLVFVITLEAGRARPADLTTMKLVLDALGIEDMNNKFAILVNKVSQPLIQKLREPEETTKLFECLNQAGRHTQFIRLNPNDAALDDLENVVVPPSQTLLELLTCLPDVTIDASKVVSIKSSDIEASNAAFEDVVTRIMEANEAEIASMRQQQEETNARLLDALARQNQLELERIQVESNSKLALAEAERKAEMERIQHVNSVANAETRRQNEAAMHQLQLKQQADKAEADRALAAVAAQQRASEDYLARQSSQNSMPPAPGSPGPLESILNIAAPLVPLFRLFF